MFKALAASLGFAYAAHSPILSAALLPTVAITVAAEAAYVIRTLRRKKVRT
jgi:uncharacterized membrane-anchored protein